jgi:formate dehydrogenase major subunit
MMTGNLGKPSSGINPLRGQNNVQGACDMGALPNVFPGYQAVTNDDLRRKFEARWGRELPKSRGSP